MGVGGTQLAGVDSHELDSPLIASGGCGRPQRIVQRNDLFLRSAQNASLGTDDMEAHCQNRVCSACTPAEPENLNRNTARISARMGMKKTPQIRRIPAKLGFTCREEIFDFKDPDC